MSLWGKTDAQISVPKYINRGQVVAINVTDGGAEYVSAPAVTISAPANGVQATATAVIDDGVVTSVVITNPGYGYVADDNITVTFASGDATADAVITGVAYDGGEIFFVDQTEAQQAENKSRGITHAGWWLYKTYTDGNGNTRHKAENLVAITVPVGTSGDANDDTVVVDRTITILVQPEVAEVADGDPAEFSVSAEVVPTETLTYQWEVSTDAGETWTDVTGETSDTLTVASIDPEYVDSNQFRVVVSATGTSDVVSDAATLTVIERTITILVQPEDVEVADGDPAEFNVSAEVSPTEPLTYQWEVSADAGENWADVTGETTDTLTVASIDPEYVTGNQFRVVVSSANASDVTSEAVTLTITV